jgi:hypothetical protein
VSLACAGCAGLIGLDQGIASAGDAGPDEDAAGDGSLRENTQLEGGTSIGHPDLDAVPERAEPTDVFTMDAGAPCPLTACPTGCFDTSTDPAHCGGCGIACTAAPNGHATCEHGVCGTACVQGWVACGGEPCSCGPGDVCLSSGACGPCLAHLQACAADTDCCSGSCLSSACL